MMGYEFHISPESFYQVNNVQTEKLYSTALDFVKDIDVGNALDLYCGIGTTTLILSKAVRHITGIEIVEKAIVILEKLYISCYPVDYLNSFSLQCLYYLICLCHFLLFNCYGLI